MRDNEELDKLQRKLYEKNTLLNWIAVNKGVREDVIQTARNVRKIMKKQFPSIKFMVRSERFSGGSSVTIYHKGKLSMTKQKEIKNWVSENLCPYRSGLLDDSYNVGYMFEGKRHIGASFISYNWEWTR